MRRRNTQRPAFTLVELVVVVGMIAALSAILMPAVQRIRRDGAITTCASNLHLIGEALTLYANDNGGALPRTRFDPDAPIVCGTGRAATDPFADLAAAPQPNDITAALWLLMRAEDVRSAVFVCPSLLANSVEPDTAPLRSQSNFTSVARNLGYSYANPYASGPAISRLAGRAAASFAVMADRNPGIDVAHGRSPFRPTRTSSLLLSRWGNSMNHGQTGQNVLYLDAHVAYERTPYCGVDADNIYTAQDAVEPNVYAAPTSSQDSVLLPAE